MDSKGWCVFSSTIEDVPAGVGKLVSFGQVGNLYESQVPSLITTVSWPGSLRMCTAIVGGGGAIIL